MVETLAHLSATAKMNFRHEDCWQVYASMIEPGIRQMIDSYFRDWQTIEMHVTAIMMKHKGVFTTRQIVTRIDGNDKGCSLVKDVEEFRKIKRSNFKSKLCYLLRNGLISKSIYDLLSELAKRRNKIHEYSEVLSEDDRVLFAYGASLLDPVFLTRCFESEKDHWKYQINANDKIAKDLLKKINDQESPHFTDALFADIDVDKVKGGWELG